MELQEKARYIELHAKGMCCTVSTRSISSTERVRCQIGSMWGSRSGLSCALFVAAGLFEIMNGLVAQ
jgi:hypothetical protein